MLIHHKPTITGVFTPLPEVEIYCCIITYANLKISHTDETTLSYSCVIRVAIRHLLQLHCHWVPLDNLLGKKAFVAS